MPLLSSLPDNGPFPAGFYPRTEEEALLVAFNEANHADEAEPALRYVTDRYGRDPDTYESVEAFLAMCRACFGPEGVPTLTERADGWHDDQGLVLAF